MPPLSPAGFPAFLGCCRHRSRHPCCCTAPGACEQWAWRGSATSSVLRSLRREYSFYKPIGSCTECGGAGMGGPEPFNLGAAAWEAGARECKQSGLSAAVVMQSAPLLVLIPAGNHSKPCDVRRAAEGPLRRVWVDLG